MNSSELRQKFLDFFEKRGHKIVSSSSLLPSDLSVLFTTAGMQQFKPYYLGEESPYGKNVVSCQKCIRTSDIEEVGDERHLTFFEMLGNFSFGGYQKEKAINLAWKFITEELGISKDRIYVTVLDTPALKPDTESYKIWSDLGLPKEKIKFGNIDDNFWGPTGESGPCGPTTEIYVDGIEIWNIVFNQYFSSTSREEAYKNGWKLKDLEIFGIDTGMGLERLTMVMQEAPTVFETDLFVDLLKLIPERADLDERKKRIVVDHARAISFLISDGAKPSNKNQGYILRRLIRRVMAYIYMSEKHLTTEVGFFEDILQAVCKQYLTLNWNLIYLEFKEEENKFRKTLKLAINEYLKLRGSDGEININQAFYLYQTFGLPFDIIKEVDINRTKNLKHEDFENELKKHQELSRTASAGMFKGGLADDKPETVKLHTAHHLLLAALQEMFGKEVKQRGSNINQERLRIDFSFDRKLTDEEKKKLEDMVNEKITADLNVVKQEMPLEEAQKIGAEMEFGVKYGNTVSVYFIEDKNGKVISKEFCGGPHVQHTKELGHFKITKEEASSQGVRRIKATLE